MRTILIVAAAVLFALPTTSHAQRRGGPSMQASPDGHVVHSRLAPVLLHRAVPPFKGVHVYQGRR